MKISVVVEITKLTKKAINYYEEEGLIKPDVNPQNNYREYSQSNVDELVQISLLRQLDVSIKEIRDIILKPKMLKDKLEQHLISLDEEINRLEKSKNVLKSCLNSITNSNDGLPELTRQLLFLNRSLEMDEREKEGFMKRQIQRIFPGNFGKMLVINFSPFLNAPINTKEEEEAWLDLVKFLDEVESIEYSKEMKEMYENLTNQDMEKYEKFLTENVNKWIGITDEELLAERKQFFEIMNRMNSDPDMQSAWQITSIMTKSLKGQMKDLGYYDKFVENLKVLSSDYSEYTNTRNEFFESLNLKVDDKGKIEVAEIR
ncbi:MerR family transcriptional regulator [Desulfosporosinus fructosivorans]|uniref:MerR family transcriptional regulator n=1 Tax=Desulfosporosinus fructosivorans TaxID=2018669 RepID=A0A4Z0QZ07_9FIRM|nr:MerR family transcriptional regulator [Desulfosporosinus fructosivorans]TGE36022.1 MerR family transcriptional regulator [Desulfosporosinus fructosivorans]